ncbi:hypothetical protein [Psychromonas aquimarina]|uniref:hypothetical protein n=1 Tax=Psychromonas aquimarina TaxID=444919 RepID=UPI00048E2367|nr:hypothetical protein [Psychromonas aquimarina]
MDFTLEQFTEFLLTTILGVILLGAVGSILGGLLVFLVKKIFVLSVERIRKYSPANRMLFPLKRSYFTAIQLRTEYVTEAYEFEYPLYVVKKLIIFALDAVIFICFALLTAIVSIIYGLDRPILLSYLISFMLFFFWKMLKTAVHSSALVGENVRISAHKIDGKTPKKYCPKERLSIKNKPN